jgi:hypothetical protein
VDKESIASLTEYWGGILIFLTLNQSYSKNSLRVIYSRSIPPKKREVCEGLVFFYPLRHSFPNSHVCYTNTSASSTRSVPV